MNTRINRLRQESFEAEPSISIERALIETEFYRENYGKYSLPVLRALVFKELCARKTIYVGDGELIVGERGPAPKVIPTFPELTCHSAEDLNVLNTRPMTNYHVAAEDIAVYEQEVIPYWQGRSMRDRVFSQLPQEWRDALKNCRPQDGVTGVEQPRDDIFWPVEAELLAQHLTELTPDNAA